MANIRSDGLDPAKLEFILLTHAHADHAGGCKQWKQQIGVRILASPVAANLVGSGDEAGISLAAAKAGGFYPPEYHFQAFPVDGELREGDTVRLGALNCARGDILCTMCMRLRQLTIRVGRPVHRLRSLTATI